MSLSCDDVAVSSRKTSSRKRHRHTKCDSKDSKKMLKQTGAKWDSGIGWGSEDTLPSETSNRATPDKRCKESARAEQNNSCRISCTSFTCFPTLSSDSVVVVMSNKYKFSFFGACMLQALSGSVQIHGYLLRRADEAVPCYSTAAGSFLTLEAGDDMTPAYNELTVKELCGDAVSADVGAYANEANRIFVLKRHQPAASAFVQQFATFRHVLPSASTEIVSPNSDERAEADARLLQSIDIHLRSDGCMSTSSSYNYVLHELTTRTASGAALRVVICGGKGAGKSTFVRFVINWLLRHVDKVALLDGDIGQSETTPAGFVSLTTMKRPLIGAPFSHQVQPAADCMIYVGAASANNDLGRYVRSVGLVAQHYFDLPDADRVPLVCNTMGYSRGIGINLLVDIVHLVRPTDFVQIQHRNLKENFPDMSVDQCRASGGWVFKSDNDTLQVKDYRFYMLASISGGAEGQWGRRGAKFGPSDLRDLTLLGYLSQLYGDAGVARYRAFNSLVPVQLEFAEFSVALLGLQCPPSQVAELLNASVVALVFDDCGEPDATETLGEHGLRLVKPPLRPAAGVGVVRRVDVHRRLLYLLLPTTLLSRRPPGRLCLLRGQVSLPACLLLQQTFRSVAADIPYVASHLTSAGQPLGRVRRFLPFTGRASARTNDER